MIRHRFTYRVSGCLCLLLVSFPPIVPHAQVYKWTDESGQTHYGDKPPDSNAEPVEIRQAPEPGPELHERQDQRRRLLEVFEEDRRREKEQQEAALREQEKREKACSRARARLERVTDAGFLYEKTDDPKNPRVLSREERARETRRLRRQVEELCR